VDELFCHKTNFVERNWVKRHCAVSFSLERLFCRNAHISPRKTYPMTQLFYSCQGAFHSFIRNDASFSIGNVPILKNQSSFWLRSLTMWTPFFLIRKDHKKERTAFHSFIIFEHFFWNSCLPTFPFMSSMKIRMN
jgi:hypothetical protein